MSSRSPVTVPLSSGENIVVGSLTWGAYKRLKARVLQAVGEELSSVFHVFRNFSGTVDASQTRLLIDAAVRALDGVSEDFALGCCRSLPQGFSLDSIDRGDAAAILSAAQELNPIGEMLEFEKNSPAGALVLRLIDLLPGGASLKTQVSELTGGLQLNPSSPSGTAGPQAS